MTGAANRLRPTDLHPFVGSDVWQLLQSRASTLAGRPFVTWQPFDRPAVTMTFDDLARDASAIAAGLAYRGVRPGQRVLIHLENCPEFLTAWFACAALGAVAVTTNTRSTVDELAYYAQDCDAIAAITQPRFTDTVATAAPGLGFIATIDHDGGVPADVSGDRFDHLRRDPNELAARPPDPLAPCSVQYTSGTTSRPKGVLWTHANALWGARSNAANEALRPDDCHLVYLPLFHTNAMAYSVLASLWAGARVVLLPKWTTTRFWEVSLRHSCTWLSLIGLSTNALTNFEHVPQHDYRLFGAAVCDLPLDARYGVKTVGWWGMTETISHPVVGDPVAPNRAMSMGRPATNYGVKVVDDNGEPVQLEQPGELRVKGIRGLSLFAEYLNQPAATADAFDADGWFRTGDLVTPHRDGHLTFENRAKDMLKVGAENVSAAEVERIIAGVPGVIEAAVVSRPDATLDEVPIAFVTTRLNEDVVADVTAACEAGLADFKRPRAVYRVAQLPRSTLNKVDKVALRAVASPGADRARAQRRWREQAQTDPSGDAI